MAKISLSFRLFSNKKKTVKSVKLCAKYPGSTQYVPRAISFFGQSLVDPDYEAWDKKQQRFSPGSRNATVNNEALDVAMTICEKALEHPAVGTITDLWKVVTCNLSSELIAIPDNSFGHFVEKLAEDMKYNNPNKLPSANYQVYRRLLRHLEKEDRRPLSNHIIRVPVDQITDEHFEQFGQYLHTAKGANYIDQMKYFKRAHKQAVKLKLASGTLTYPYSDHAPVKTFDELLKMSKGISSLSSSQIEEIENFDVSKITLRGKDGDFYKQLYLDTCLLMHYLFTRPIDILNMKVTNIRRCSKGMYIEYLPIKKKNNNNPEKAVVKCPICDKAFAIIKKYSGMSPTGYLLPFGANMRTWNLSDPNDYHKRYNRTAKILNNINIFLKKLGEAIGIYFENDTFTSYIFRHSAITIAISEKNIPPMMVAKMAGTSMKEIERSYMDHTTTMFEYF